MRIPSSTSRAALVRLIPLIFSLAIAACDSTSKGSGTGGAGGMMGTGGAGGMMGTGGGGGTMGTGGGGGMMGTGGTGGMGCGTPNGCTGTSLWSKRFGDAMAQAGKTLAVDAAGNIILGAAGQGAVDFGGGSLVNASTGIYLVKLDPTGNHLWSKHFEANSSISFLQANATVVDAAGNVLVAGAFNGTVDFGGGPLTETNYSDVCLAKFDPNGNHLWSKRFGDASSFQQANAAAIDAAGNILITGYFSGSVDFGGGVLTSAGLNDIFVAKFDPNGNHLWSKQFGDYGEQQAWSTAVDAAGNVLITGQFQSVADFGGGPLISLGVSDIFVAKLDPNGNHLWSKSFGDPSDQQAWNTSVDAAGNVLLTGYFQGTVDFGGGTLVSSGNNDIFVARFDPNGNHLWSKSFGDASDEQAKTTSADAAGNVLLTGQFQGTVDFGGGILSSAGQSDIFVAKFDPSGNHLWSKSFGDTSFQQAIPIVDAAGDVLIAGQFQGTVDFGNGPLTSAGSTDIFVAKFNP